MIAPLQRLTTALSDRYRVERELGAGGMATVYLAHDLKHKRDVAIKVLHPDLGAALGAERFLSEIRTTARLQHPHILPLLDSGAADGLLYYVMPYVRGETLRARPRAQAGRDSPRHQAGEHPPAGWRGRRRRLRHRPRRAASRRPAHDANGALPRHAAVHEPRAGDG
ncbi:MAG: protein kinase [Gemmatimonas sp.]|nr:protein kinase [Gemmatimonas sp.]